MFFCDLSSVERTNLREEKKNKRQRCFPLLFRPFLPFVNEKNVKVAGRKRKEVFVPLARFINIPLI